MAILNKLSTKQPDIMALVRSLVITTLQHNILFQAKHIPGKSNTIADLLSCSQVARAKAAAPWLDEEPHQVPPAWLPW